MQVSVDQLFSQIGRLQVEKSALEQANGTLAQEVLKLRKELEDLKPSGISAEGQSAKVDSKVLQMPGPEEET